MSTPTPPVFPHTITIRLDPELEARVKQEAADQVTKASEVIRQALREHFRRKDGEAAHS